MDGQHTRAEGELDALVTLDRVAAHVIEARGLLASLPAGKRGDLSVCVDVLLAAVGRRIAMELSARGIGPGTPEPEARGASASPDAVP